MKGTGGGNAQITRGSDRSTRHRHPQSCLFITVATSTTGHVQRLSGVLSSTRRQLPGGGPGSHAQPQRPPRHPAQKARQVHS